MKTLLAGLAAILALGGCVTVPYAVEPAPAYGYYYSPPPATFSFHYGYDRGYGGHRGHHGHRHYRR